jgi:hypothetical protein
MDDRYARRVHLLPLSDGARLHTVSSQRPASTTQKRARPLPISHEIDHFCAQTRMYRFADGHSNHHGRPEGGVA